MLALCPCSSRRLWHVPSRLLTRPQKGCPVGRDRNTSTRPSAASQSNLGQLLPLAEPDAASSSTPLVIEQFSGTIPTTIDGPAVASSLIVLFLLLALSFNRIFGLERLVGQWLRQLAEQRDEERRSESQAARQALERQFGGDDGGKGGKDDSA
ncbi:hypothetical protein D9Q98_007784 [Chlorella vulgaris]|uniref:Uncharacterized protein n=1 Tax=Chlorella vulgaris TaxID=3077 RepID=A0A9D4THH2_CHLVU|nr:hypothetical protein D9Q98_007784 [Chlorella vulgaris]